MGSIFNLFEEYINNNDMMNLEGLIIEKLCLIHFSIQNRKGIC